MFSSILRQLWGCSHRSSYGDIWSHMAAYMVCTDKGISMTSSNVLANSSWVVHVVRWNFIRWIKHFKFKKKQTYVYVCKNITLWRNLYMLYQAHKLHVDYSNFRLSCTNKCILGIYLLYIGCRCSPTEAKCIIEGIADHHRWELYFCGVKWVLAIWWMCDFLTACDDNRDLTGPTERELCRLAVSLVTTHDLYYLYSSSIMLKQCEDAGGSQYATNIIWRILCACDFRAPGGLIGLA